MKKTLKLVAAYGVYIAVILGLVVGAYSLHNRSPSDSEVFQEGKGESRRVNVNEVNVMESAGDKVEGTPGGETEKVWDSKGKYIILTFDDGWSSQYEAFQKLRPFKGTLYISSSLIGKEDRLTLENLTEMYNNGWDISNHTVSHTNLAKVNMEKVREEAVGCSEWIKEQGFVRNEGFRHIAYPEGGYNDAIKKILREEGFLTARTTEAGSSTADVMQLGRMSLHGMSVKNIRDNILSDKQLLILSFHRIVPDNCTELKEIDLQESYFEEVIRAIKDSKRKVITITEWYEMNYPG